MQTDTQMRPVRRQGQAKDLYLPESVFSYCFLLFLIDFYERETVFVTKSSLPLVLSFSEKSDFIYVSRVYERGTVFVTKNSPPLVLSLSKKSDFIM